MATSANANINVIVNTSQALAQLKSLQAQVAATNQGMAASSAGALAQQSALNKALMNSANASRMWNAQIIPMTTATDRFSESIDKGRLSLGQYSRYAASQLPGMSRVFKREFDMMSRVAEQNVRRMQTQYVALGKTATGASQAMALTPNHLNNMASASAMATQRQVLMNRMIDLGSTKLLNWGKNTQWAGRQLMVGFTLPLAMLGTVAAKTFKEIDQSSISFKRVYGNLSTTTAEMERNLEAVKDLGMEYTKYGKSLSSTIELAAKVAATGAQGESLSAATEQTIRLATLGLMEYDEALGATIALQTAFGVSNEDLTSTIDFLNVTENETILTMQDMAAAIPRVAPVVKGLGGDIKDLAVMMTAMREGGVTAEQGANAIKSGLGRLINPTKAAREEMGKYGISIDAITQKNKGDLMATLDDFGTALATLGDFEQQQVLQKVFGTYQYARLGALFKNLVRDGSQAKRTLELTSMSVEDLASVSEKELSKIEEATSTKFAAAMERLKVSIAPIGETFMKAIMPVIDFVAKIANAFNDLPDGIKKAITIGIAVVAGIGPIILMTIGLLANGIANIVKLTQTTRKFFARLKGDSSAFQHLTAEEHEARGAADALSRSTDNLTGKFLGQRKALDSLVGMLGNYSKALSATVMSAPMMMGAASPRGKAGRSIVTGPQTRGVVARGYSKGVTKVPGMGNEDTIPALLTPGESVVTKEATQKYSSIIAAMNAGTLPGFNSGITGYTNQVVPMTASANLSKLATSAPSAEQLGSGLAAGFARGFAKKTAQEVAVAEAAYKRLTPVMNQFYNNFQAEVDQTIKATGKATLNEQQLEQARLRAAKTTAAAIKAQETATGRRVLSGPLRTSAMQFMGAPGYTAPITTLNRTGAGHADPLGRASLMGVRSLRSMENPTTRDRLGIGYKGFGRGLSEWAGQKAGISGPMHFGHLSSPKAIPLSAADQMASRPGASTTAPKVIAAVRSGAAATASALRAGGDSALGISSPSKVAENTMKQYVDGIETGTKKNTTRASAAGKVVGNSFAASVKAAILSGGALPPLPPIGGGKTMPAEEPRPQSAAAKQAKMIKDQIIGARAEIKTSGNTLKQDTRGIFKEMGNIFRILPQLGKELLRNLKEPMQILGGILRQISGPYVKPIVDAFKFLRDTVVGNVKLAAALFVNDIKKIPVILKGAVSAFTTKVKSAFEMAALRTSVAMDSIKSLPAKVKSAYENAAIRTIIALDSIKKLPETMKNKAADLQRRFNDFKTNLPQNLMRAKNQAFYRGQDAINRGKESLRGISEKFAKMRERFSASNAQAASSLREGSMRGAARSYVPDAAAAQVKTISEQITKAATNVKAQLTQAAKSVTDSARLAKILLKDGDLRGAMRAMTPDKVAQAFTAATKPIINASKVAYGKLVDGAKFIDSKVKGAAEVVSKKLSSAGQKLSAAGAKLANSIQVAGQALAMKDPRTALRALTPDKVASALGSAKVRAGEMYGAARDKAVSAALSAKATGITAYNALLARDVKTFIKALTPDKVWAASSKLVASISNAGKQVAAAGKFAYDTIIFNAKAAIALGPGIIKDGFNYVRSSLITGANFIKDTIAVNVRAALVVGASEIKKAFVTAKTFIANGGKFIFDTVKVNIGAALLLAKNEITRIGGILKTEGPKLKASLTDAAKGMVGAVKGAGVILADSIKSVGSLVRAAGASLVQGGKGFLKGGFNENTGTNRGQRLAGSGNTAMMGLMGLSMAASFAGGSVGEMAQKIMPVTMGLMGLQMILPMLTNPMGLAIIATTALVGGFIYLRKQLDDTAKEAANLGANIGGVANGMKIIEEATGFKAPDAKDRLFRFSDEDREAMGQFGSYFESEGGSKFIEDLRNATSEERYQKVSTLLTQAVASGLEEDKAKAFGMAIAEATGDALLNSSIARDFANQVFGQGSKTLIDLEETRMKSAPEVDLSKINLEGGRFGATNRKIEKETKESGGGISGYFSNILRTINVFNTAIDVVGGQAESIEKVAVAAEGLGFALQTIQNLTTAEAVLEEERSNGIIKYEEYAKRLSELNGLQEDAANYIGEIYSLGADSGAMSQALGNQLSFAGFSEDTISRVSEAFNPDALAKQFFGEDKTFEGLGENERNYVEQVLTKTLSGLTPENVSQRLQDIEASYTDMAEKAVQAMTDGTMDALGGLDFFFNKENISDYISSRMGGGIAGVGGLGGTSPEKLASNLLKQDTELKKMGTDSLQVFTRLGEFIDVDFGKKILSSKEDILKFGDIVAKLGKYKDINLEIVMKNKNLTPELIISSIEKINKIKLDPDIFGRVPLDGEKLVTTLVKAGVEIDDLPEKISKGAKKLEEFGKEAVDSLGDLKPKIVPKIIASVFGKSASTSEGIANALNSAFPDGLKPIDIMVLLSLKGDDLAIALLSNPLAMKAAKAGEKTFTQSVVVDGEVINRTQVVPQSLLSVAPFLSGGTAATEDTTDDTEDTGGGGAAEKQKSALQEMISALNASLKLYGTAKTLTKKILKSKKDFNNFLKELSFDGGVSDQLREMNLSESLIADLLSLGGKNAKRIMKALGGRSGLTRLDKASTVSKAGQRVDEATSRQEREGYKATARTRLEKDGSFTKEEIDKILESEEDVEIIAKFPIKKNKDKWNELKSALQSDAKIELTVELKPDLEKFDEAKQIIEEAYDELERKKVNELADKFKEANGATVEEMERQVVLNQRIITQEQDKIDKKQEEISDYQRTNDLIQQGMDDVKRQDELRNRVSEGISKDLESMSKQEDEIRKAHDKRIEALDKVAAINDYIVNQQKQQLGLSQALSSGDIYAATAAAQEMRATSTQFAAEQARQGLQEGMENQVAGLRTSGGLTREQAEQQIADIKEQSYQTSLLLRIEEDKIYANNLLVRDLTNQIYIINEDMIEPLNNKNLALQRTLDYHRENEAYAIRELALAGVTRAEWERKAGEIEASITPAKNLDIALAGVAGSYLAVYEAALKALSVTGMTTPNIGTLPAEAADDSSWEFIGGRPVFANSGGMIKKYSGGGSILGQGSRDSVSAMLTPGEFVIKKSMVDKYGIPMLSKINQGSFFMPKFNTSADPETKVSGSAQSGANIVAPMYNNYSVSVNVSGSNASADEIANKTIMKIKQMQGTQIRSGRGY
jgi:TP901 family phage tail tape measure protein